MGFLTLDNQSLYPETYIKLLATALLVIEVYHPDAVIVEAGKKATYGKEAIKEELMEFLKTGDSMKIQEGHYQMSDDYIIYNGIFENTLQSGVVKGKFTQIWRKVGDTYQLLRDEYSWE
ncbi:unnamed protein product [Cylicocyclus nassatus]|uniref:DUF4440 domain-containing protein n=1 Tax=Cylicocyclus nassatus TaxID=53992 RepID=A0AA36GTW7_CYLNA|nr:unnamed protein product [Cylicocyclus nassatus]